MFNLVINVPNLLSSIHLVIGTHLVVVLIHIHSSNGANVSILMEGLFYGAFVRNYDFRFFDSYIPYFL